MPLAFTQEDCLVAKRKQVSDLKQVEYTFSIPTFTDGIRNELQSAIIERLFFTAMKEM